MLGVVILNDVEPLGKVKVIIDQVRITDNDFELMPFDRMLKIMGLAPQVGEGH